ncbi:uncharacterized protein BX664DRAFT_288302 [Halteromyces radiatus]|uniref:uncharacterized protein n=1 Tax=Halteromyces radiatus TaxID=101107 RepID=UPI00221F1461|nr:uncharacterized protein BX664DRAFT_288302 [Halteromyces radiatus]KAI8098681.1 hypothetical protein BX664DRAFT_288302 [Halteromyces radiatus]
MSKLTKSDTVALGPLLSTKPTILWIHDPSSSFTQDVVINPEAFPTIRDGQLLRLHFVNNTILEPLIVKATCADRESLGRQHQLQISICKDIAERLKLRFRPEICIELIDPSLPMVALDHVELAFKEQYLGRSDMWRLQQSLAGTCAYLEKKILFAGAIKTTVKKMWSADKEVTSGYISDTTRLIFRSASAKYFVFIQMSREMWEFDEDGELYYEKVVNNFLPQLFNRWKEQGTNHVVSIILFTRVFYDTMNDLDDDTICQGEDGRFYKDFYKVLADWETTDDWTSIIGPLKEEQLQFQQNVLTRTDNGITTVNGQIAMAFEGNILESVNLALNPFDRHFVDRDLMRTGLSIILVTPGAGKFTVNKKLLRLTNERMTDNGIAMDLVCLSRLPLHITPLLRYASAPPPDDWHDGPAPPPLSSRHSKPTTNSPDMKITNFGPTASMIASGYQDPLYHDDKMAPSQWYYSVPHWIDCSFYHHETGRFLKQDKFKTRCKMYEIQMMGIMESDIASVHVPYLADEQQRLLQQRSSISTREKTLRSQKSSGSLNERASLKTDDGGPLTPQKSSLGNDDNYLSRSANFTMTRRSSYYGQNDTTQQQQQQQQQLNENSDGCTIDVDQYDSLVFKDTLEPRFSKRAVVQSSKIASSGNKSGISKNSMDGPESDYTRTNIMKHATSTWHHNNDQRRITSILSQSQQTSNKITFDDNVRKDDSSTTKISDLFKSSPTHHRPNSGGNSTTIDDSRHRPTRRNTGNTGDDDDSVLISSSTVDPMPINNNRGGFGGRTDSRKSNNHSPRQTIVSGSLPSIHKHSGNSDVIRTSFGGGGGTGGTGANRSSPSHGWGSRSSAKQTTVNPCNPSEHAVLFTSHLRRWQHALPKHDSYDGPVVYWKSLATPACLPLTTDYFPSNEELKLLYNHYMYTVSASEDVNLYQAGDRNLSELKKTEILLTEMISQRLAQGFQIIVDITGSSNYQKSMTTAAAVASKVVNPVSNESPGSTFASNFSNSMFSNKDSRPPATGGISNAFSKAATTQKHHTPSLNKTTNITTGIGGTQDDGDKMRWKHMVWWLSMGHQVHQLTFDSSGQNVEVRRYVRLIDFDDEKMGYKCAIWPKNISGYRSKSVTFNYPSLLYAWNYLDHLVAGYQEELTDNLRFWRARFIVIPREQLPVNAPFIAGTTQDHLNEEEKRLALFDTWLQNLRKAKWLSPSEREEMQRRKKKEIGYDFGLKVTTMDPSAYVSQQQGTGSGYNNNNNSTLFSSIGNLAGQSLSLSRDSKSKDIANAMRDPKTGVKIMDRRWHFKVFRGAFIGSECVDWLIGHFDDINSREDAVAFGNALMKRSPPLFVSSSNRHGFLDGHYFYQFHEEFAPGHQRSCGNGGSKDDHDGSDTKDIDETRSNLQQRHDKPTTEFEMARSMIIDVDPYKKSDRRETAILHYDTIHNPNNCYHFQLNWLGCTAQLVQELLRSWSLQADRCGLKVVEGSVEQAYDDSENNNPFQCPVPIPLALPPPPIDDLKSVCSYDVPDQFYEIALVRHLGFVLDVEADAQFERARINEGVQVTYPYIKCPYKYDQYIHRTGVAFVQIRRDGQGFYWVNNRLYTNHTPALVSRRRDPSTSQLQHPDYLRRQFQQSCSNSSWLASFWSSTRSRLLKLNGDEEEEEEEASDLVDGDVVTVDNRIGQDADNEATNNSELNMQEQMDQQQLLDDAIGCGLQNASLEHQQPLEDDTTSNNSKSENDKMTNSNGNLVI